jgi:hypothetical protein
MIQTLDDIIQEQKTIQGEAIINLIQDVAAHPIMLGPACARCGQPTIWDDCSEFYTTYWCETCDRYAVEQR